MVGWPKLLRSVTARALVRRFSKDLVIAGTATTAAVLVLAAIHDNPMTDKPPRPPADVLRTAIRIEPPATVTVTSHLTEAEPAATPAPHASIRKRSGPRLSGPETTRPVAPAQRLASAARPAPSGAAISDEPPTVSPPLDLQAFARTSDGPRASPETERPWTFGSSLRLARTAAETATSRVLAWKHRVTTSTAWLLDGLP
ncbi:MAG: hypothetical protein HXX10_13160 [Rhodoplanes sp.]|uniref:hypothetical protein n=1 Tax=Rhodoplanes sp. TaxID=1968906 RepID=UPI0017E04062|nr:hypothetical protein [Rhodoplanes sp.]NVO14978.1 hypothetical protein [Rhodoplanes sp.]